MPRQLTAIMFTDITGFTSLMAQNENRALEVLEQNRQIQKRLIKKYHGIWLKEIGDGIMSCFSSVLNAVYCANAIKMETADLQGVKLKYAIHTGEVVFNNGDVFGDGVNVASRIEEISPSDKICISGAVYENIKNVEGLKIEFQGEKKFKNVDQTIPIYEVEVLEESKIHEPKPSLGFQDLAGKQPLLEIDEPVHSDYEKLDYEARTFSLYGYAWDRVLKNIVPLLIISIFLAIVQGGSYAVNQAEDVQFNVLSGIIWLFLSAPLEYGASWIYLKAVRKQEFELKEIQVGFYYYLNVIFARVLTAAIVGIGIVMLIIPGIIFACRLAFVPYLVVDKGYDAIQAVQESWSMTRGHGWRIFGMGMLAIPIVIAGFIAFFVGVIFAAMWISLAFAALYARVAETYKFKEK